jgi:16S rRNA (adenine1518-N6/adenine1519-N6)-dimethyltransferase
MYYKKEKSRRPAAHGIAIKKQFGQHFLRDQKVVDRMIERVALTKQTRVFEIGCGDGFLTKSILQQPLERLWVFEIDPEWAVFVEKQYPHPKLTIFQENILDTDFSRLAPHAPWTLLANLPYSVTFPILHVLQKNRTLLDEAVVMIQEEVAQKLVKKSGRGYGYVSLFFQYYFDLELLERIKPGAFVPPPQVDSRLVYLKPKKDIREIPDEAGFWKFIKACFSQPRRILRNSLAAYAFDLKRIPEKYHEMRSQQLAMADFLEIWDLVRIIK